MALSHLRPQPKTRITTSWGHALVDILEDFYARILSGENDIVARDILARYGYFSAMIYSEGKPVIRDGDPVSIYDITSYVQKKITGAIDTAKVTSITDLIREYTGSSRDLLSSILSQLDTKLSTRASESTLQQVQAKIPSSSDVKNAIDTSLLTQYTQGVHEKVVQLRIDDYGNVGVVIAEPLDTYGNVKTGLAFDFIGLAKETTLQAIKSKVDQLKFDEYGNVLARPVDPDAELLDATGLIDTAVDTSPHTIITPPSGMKVDIRRTYVATNSTSGEIYVKFAVSGKLITAIFPTKYGFVVMPAVRIVGNVDEPVQVEWSGLDANAKIAYTVNYKLA